MSEPEAAPKLIENPFATNGAISWAELASKDPAASMEFYSKIFGWEYVPMEMPNGTYNCISVDGAMIGGIMQTPCPEGTTQWCSYVTVSDIETINEAVKANGGNVLMGPHKIDGVGTIIMFRDPLGALIAAIEYDPNKGC